MAIKITDKLSTLWKFMANVVYGHPMWSLNAFKGSQNQGKWAMQFWYLENLAIQPFSSQEKKPGELLHADLGDFQNPSMPAVSISPQPLPAIKKADPYERTDYAVITQFLKGNAILPPNDGNEDTEMKPKCPSKKEIQGNDKETPI